MKYLETLFSESTYDYFKNDSMRTMEAILMKEIKFSFEQTKRIESLVKQKQVKAKASKWSLPKLGGKR